MSYRGYEGQKVTALNPKAFLAEGTCTKERIPDGTAVA